MNDNRIPGTRGAAAATAATAIAALAVATSPLAHAADTGWTSNWYAGASIGQSHATIDDDRIIASLLGSGLATTRISNDDRSTGGKLFAGYQLNRNFALEGGYFNLGHFGYQATTNPAGTLTGRIELQGLNLDLVGSIPVTDRFSVFGRVGVAYSQARDHFAGTGFVRVTNPDPRKNGANVKFGAGMQYDFSEAFSVRAEAERYRVNDAVGNKGDIDLYSVGLLYRFGQKSPSPVVRTAAPAPAPVVMAPAAAPVVVAPPPPPPPPTSMRVSFAADSLFDFNKSTVKPAGRQALDKFAADLRGASYDVITVTGHTDRIGTHAYNMKLSTSRANAVKDYLVKSAGISAASISATGVDGAQPVTKPGECKGNKPTPKLIACLQPDRRVDVEVSGTR